MIGVKHVHFSPDVFVYCGTDPKCHMILIGFSSENLSKEKISKKIIPTNNESYHNHNRPIYQNNRYEYFYHIIQTLTEPNLVVNLILFVVTYSWVEECVLKYK